MRGSSSLEPCAPGYETSWNRGQEGDSFRAFPFRVLALHLLAHKPVFKLLAAAELEYSGWGRVRGGGGWMGVCMRVAVSVELQWGNADEDTFPDT